MPEDCELWKIRACMNTTTNCCVDVNCPDHDTRKCFANIPTCDLVNEIVKREGVKELVCPNPDCSYVVFVHGKHGAVIGHAGSTGPSRILVVTD